MCMSYNIGLLKESVIMKGVFVEHRFGVEHRCPPYPSGQVDVDLQYKTAAEQVAC